MKKFTLIPATLFGFLILTVGLTSCSRKYGCYYSETTELKTRDFDTACVDFSSSADADICYVLPNTDNTGH